MADRVAPYGLGALVTGKGATHDVRMPDGTIIRNVPVGTTKQQIIAKMATGKMTESMLGPLGPLLHSLWSAGTKSPDAPAGPRELFTHDYTAGADIPAGAAGAALGNVATSPFTGNFDPSGAYRKSVDQQRASIDAGRQAHPVGGGLSEIAGAVASAPGQLATRGLSALTKAGMKAPKIWPIIPSTLDAMGWGGMMGASEGKDVTGSAIGAGLGNLAGNAALKATSRILSPILSRTAEQLAAQGITLTPYQKSVRTLHDYGVKLTPGQIAGVGPTRAVEDTFSTLPSLQKVAQRQSIMSYNLAKVKDAVAPVGDLPAATAGRDAIGKARGMVTGAYKNALNGVSVPLSDSFHGNLDTVVNSAVKKLTPNQFKAFQNEIADNVTPFLQGDTIPGEGFQAIKQGLQTRIAKYSNSPIPADDHVAGALKNYLGVVMDEFKNGAPDAYSLYKAADQAHANLTPIEDAAAKNRTDGVVTPFQMAGPAHKVGYGRTRSNLAAGTAPGQDFVDAANMVLPPTMPSSFTTERGLIWKLLGMGGSGGAAAAAGAAAPAAGTIGALSIPYIPPVARAIQAARLGSRGTVLDAIAHRLKLAAPAGGMAVAPLVINNGQ